MNVGIVGAGTIFHSHAAAYAELGLHVKGLVDVDLARAQEGARKYGIDVVGSDWRLLADDPTIDLIDVCTPPRYHQEPTVAALRAGKHVVCEKPLAHTLEAADAIVQEAGQAKGRLTVVHQLRLQPVFQQLQWLVHSGNLGRIAAARVLRYDPPPAALVQEGRWGRWEVDGGGVLLTKAVHELDLLLWILGKVKRVQAYIGTFFNPIESEDQVVASLEFESGALGSVCICGSPSGYRREFEVIGAQGTFDDSGQLRMADPERAANLHAEMARALPAASDPAPGSRRLGVRSRLGRLGLWSGKRQAGSYHATFLRAFLDSLPNGPPPVTPADARNAVELCTALYSSALTSQPVELPLTTSARYYQGVRTRDYVDSIGGANRPSAR